MEAKHKNMLIVALLALVMIMAVGYAAFAQNLNINSTSEVSSKWEVKITNIAVKKVMVGGVEQDDITGTASNKTTFAVDEDFPSTSATINEAGTMARFSSELRSPGDSITYDVTITNSGTLNAKVGDIQFEEANATTHCIKNGTTCLEDDPIYYGFTGLAQNDVITANGGTAHVYVTVTYDENVTSQPEANIEKYATLRVDCVQAQ